MVNSNLKERMSPSSCKTDSISLVKGTAKSHHTGLGIETSKELAPLMQWIYHEVSSVVVENVEKLPAAQTLSYFMNSAPCFEPGYDFSPGSAAKAWKEP